MVMDLLQETILRGIVDCEIYRSNLYISSYASMKAMTD